MNKKILYRIFPFLLWTGIVNKKTIKLDLIASLTGAIIVLPQAIAFATIAGVPPIYGLYTAMVTTTIASLFGSSWHLISGPTTAISLVIFSAVSEFAIPESLEYIQLVLMLTFLVGVFQLVMGLARLGTLINFISHSVIIGFTAGAAVLIITSQMGKILGIEVSKENTFIDSWYQIFLGLNNINFYVFNIAIASLIIALIVKKFTPRLPHLLIAMILTSVVTYFIEGHEHGVTLVGKLSASLPSFSLPNFERLEIRELIPFSFAIALLGLIEAVAIAKSIATKSGQRIDGSQEFIGQGLSNIVGSFFSSYVGSGSFTRSGVNYESGAKTPLSAIFSAILLMLILLLVASLTAYLPIAAMGGIILLVAYNLIDFQSIKQLFKSSNTEAAVFLVTFFSTLFLRLEFAVYLGIITSLMFYLRKTANPNIVTLTLDKRKKHSLFLDIEQKAIPTCPQLRIIRIDGSLFFGSVDKIETFFSTLYNTGEPNLLIVSNGIGFIDLAGGELLKREAIKWRTSKRGFYFCSLQKPIIDFLRKGGFLSFLDEENIFESKQVAIEAIYNKLNQDECSNCTIRSFRECSK